MKVKHIKNFYQQTENYVLFNSQIKREDFMLCVKYRVFKREVVIFNHKLQGINFDENS